MAGQPIKRQMLADIEKSGGFQNILDRVCSGESMTAIARSFGVSRKLLVSTLYKDPKQKELLEGARKETGEALTDILYVTYGAGHAFGVDLDKCFEEVQKSNMSKLDNDGKPIYNESGKVMKGPNYFKPDLSKFIK